MVRSWSSEGVTGPPSGPRIVNTCATHRSGSEPVSRGETLQQHHTLAAEELYFVSQSEESPITAGRLMNILTFAGLAAGLMLLVLGGEFLVRGASRLAIVAGVSPLVIGLTIVAAGTSSPELAVSVQASLGGNPDVSMGNVVGSNIFNTLGILGLCALFVPLIVHSKVVRVDIPIMIGASLLMAALAAFDRSLDWYDGLILLALFVLYTGWTIVQSRRENRDVKAEFDAEFDGGRSPHTRTFVLKNIALVLAGLGVLVVGARLLVDSGVELASSLGVSDAVIGLTIIAIGTSLPEVATSVIATIRNERDIAVGNVVGSNIFNILGILGVASVIAPLGGDSALAVKDTIAKFDLPIMVATAVVCLPMLFKGRLVRWEGISFIAAYAAYVVFLILTETGSGARGTFALALLLFSPLVLAVMGWSVFRALRPASVEPVEAS